MLERALLSVPHFYMPGDSFTHKMYSHLLPPGLCHSQGGICYILPFPLTKYQETNHTDLTVLQESPSSFEYCLSNWSNTTLHSCLASFPSDFAFSYDDKKRCWQHTVISHIYWKLTVTLNFLYISTYSWRLPYLSTTYFNKHVSTPLQLHPDSHCVFPFQLHVLLKNPLGNN